MRKYLTLLLVLCSIASVTAQKNSNTDILTVDGVGVPTKEFYDMFFRNYATTTNPEDKTIDGYMNKFVEYRTLLKEAKDKGLDTTAIFAAGVKAYTQEMLVPYYQDTVSLHRLAVEAFERGKHDIRVSHILVEVSPFAFAKDSLAAKARIDSIYQRLKAGDDFATLANQIHKTDTNGDMGYITALQLPYEIETAVYNTPVGDISKPFRSKLGYHIVKPLDKRPARGLVELSHILVYKKEDPTENAQAISDIREAYAKLKQGENFEKVVMNYTEDASTQASGGYIGVYGIGELLPEVEDMVFALEKEGDFTKIIATSNGWDVIKLVHRVPMDDFAARKGELYTRVAKDERYISAMRIYMNSKKSLYPITIDQAELQATQDILSNMGFLIGKIEMNLITNAEKGLFTIADSTYKVRDFYNGLLYSLEDYGQDTELAQVIKSKLDDFISAQVMVKYVASLPKTDPKVIAEIENFKDQALVYTLVSTYVNNKMSVVDMETLMGVYDKNQSKYLSPESIKVLMLMCDDPSVEEKVKTMLAQDKSYLEIMDALNKGISTVVQGSEFVDTAENVFDMPDKKVEVGQIETVREDGKVFVIKVLEIIPSAKLSYDEALPLVNNDYKTQMAERLPKDIQDKHSVIINPKVLKTIKKEFPKELKKRGL